MLNVSKASEIGDVILVGFGHVAAEDEPLAGHDEGVRDGSLVALLVEAPVELGQVVELEVELVIGGLHLESGPEPDPERDVGDRLRHLSAPASGTEVSGAGPPG